MINEKKIHYAWWILITCFLIPLTVTGIVVSSAGIFYAPVCKELGFSRGTFSLYVTVSYLIMAVVIPFAGTISSKHNYKNFKKYLIISLSIYLLSFAAASQFSQLWHWYAMGAVLGITGAFCKTTAVPTMITNWFKDKLGMAMGLSLASTGLGATIFNPIGAWLITNYGWRTGYLWLGLIGFIVTVPLAAIVLKFRPSDIGLEPYGAEKATAAGQTTASSTVSGVTAIAAAKTSAFYWIVGFVACTIIAGIVSVHIPGFLTSLGHSTMVGAFTVSVFSMCLLVGKMLIGIVNDAVGMAKTTVVFTVIGLIGVALLIYGAISKNTMLLYTGAGLFGFALATSQVQPPLLIKEIFGTKEYLKIFSNVTAGGLVIQAVAVSIYGFIYDLTGVYAYSIVMAGVIFAISAVCFLCANASKRIIQD